MNKESQILAFLGFATIAIFLGGIFFFSGSNKGDNSTVNTEILYSNTNIDYMNNNNVIIVEFGDFQCPACAVVHSTLKKVLSERGDSVQFVFRHFPLPQHQNALISSLAVEAAGLQGKYWEMYNLLYENQSQWANSDNPEEFFIQFAKNIDLDTEQFKNDFDNDEIKAKIAKDAADAQALGINATPTFYLNGEKLELPTYDNFIQAIDQQLNK